MALSKLLVLFIIALIFLSMYRWGFVLTNKYILIGLILTAALGVFFSDTVYHAFSRRIMRYAQSPEGTQLPFMSERWKRANVHNPNDNNRQAMVDDFLSKYKLLGKSRSEIINLLGGPDSTTDFPGWDLKYCLGQNQRSFNVEWLVIILNDGDTVDKYTIVSK